MKRPILIVGLLALILVLGGWYFLSGSTPVAPDLTTSGDDSVDQGLISTLLELRAVKLDGTILSDPGFLSLRDFSTQIIPEPVGRPNPFMPISGSASAASGAQSGPSTFTPKR